MSLTATFEDINGTGKISPFDVFNLSLSLEKRSRLFAFAGRFLGILSPEHEAQERKEAEEKQAQLRKAYKQAMALGEEVLGQVDAVILELKTQMDELKAQTILVRDAHGRPFYADEQKINALEDPEDRRAVLTQMAEMPKGKQLRTREEQNKLSVLDGLFEKVEDMRQSISDSLDDMVPATASYHTAQINRNMANISLYKERFGREAQALRENSFTPQLSPVFIFCAPPAQAAPQPSEMQDSWARSACGLVQKKKKSEQQGRAHLPFPTCALAAAQ